MVFWFFFHLKRDCVPLCWQNSLFTSSHQETTCRCYGKSDIFCVFAFFDHVYHLIYGCSDTYINVSVLLFGASLSQILTKFLPLHINVELHCQKRHSQEWMQNIFSIRMYLFTGRIPYSSSTCHEAARTCYGKSDFFCIQIFFDHVYHLTSGCSGRHINVSVLLSGTSLSQILTKFLPLLLDTKEVHIFLSLSYSREEHGNIFLVFFVFMSKFLFQSALLHVREGPQR